MGADATPTSGRSGERTDRRSSDSETRVPPCRAICRRAPWPCRRWRRPAGWCARRRARRARPPRRLGLATPGQLRVGDREIEMFGHLVFVEHGADFTLIFAAPRSGRFSRVTAAAILPILRSVATSSSSRLRARSRARSGLRQTINRSPGKSGEVIAAMSRSSKSDICRTPPFARVCRAGARSAVIQSRPAGRRSSSMRACVSCRDRRPARHARARTSVSAWRVGPPRLGLPVFPSNTSMAIGQPSAAHTGDRRSASPFLPSRL